MKVLNSERGSLTIDYIFAIVLVMGFCMAVMAFSSTLVTVEVVQYAAYAGARRFFAGNMDMAAQESAGSSAIAGILNNKIVQPMFQSGWFALSNSNTPVEFCVGQGDPGQSNNNPTDCSKFSNSGSVGNQGPYGTFEGVIIPFDAKLLAFKVPFFGSTIKSSSSGTNQGFNVDINSFLGREPTFSDCEGFWNNRWKAIQALGYKVPSSTNPPVEMDNGC